MIYEDISVSDGTQDIYPSRTGESGKLLERLDPVVYAKHPAASNAPASPLDYDLIRQYDKNGFIVLENVFSEEEVARFKQELDRLRQDQTVKSAGSTITELGEEEVRSIFRVHESSEIFADLASDVRLAGLARYILDDEVYIHQSRLNYKPGFSGKEFYWHSDFETWHVEDGMPRMRALSMSVTLAENYPYNGPLMLIPGSHRHFVMCEGVTPEEHYKSSLKKQEYGVPNNECLEELVRYGGVVAATCKPGSVIVFDCNVMHGSAGNITPFPRTNAFFVYNAMKNRVEAPFSGGAPRPEYLCSREKVTPIVPQVVRFGYDRE